MSIDNPRRYYNEAGYGVKNGTLSSRTGKFKYFSSADIGWNWRFLNEEVEAVPAKESEVPQYSEP